jgi:hypothetical protein
MQPEGATPADVGFGGNHEAPNGWESPPAAHSKVGKTFSLRNLTERRDFPRHFFTDPLWDSAYVFHDPSFPLVSSVPFMHDLAQAILVFLFSVSAASIPLGVEIIGTAFRTGFQILYNQAAPPPSRIFAVATSGILANPHSHHIITLRNFPRQAEPHDRTITLDWL